MHCALHGGGVNRAEPLSCRGWVSDLIFFHRMRYRSFTLAGAGPSKFIIILRFIFHEIVARIKYMRTFLAIEPIKIVVFVEHFAVAPEVPVCLLSGIGLRV